MINYSRQFGVPFRSMALLLVVTLFSSTTIPLKAQAQSINLNLPPVGAMVGLSEDFSPSVIKGIKVFPNNPFRFDFIVDTGDSNLEGEDLSQESAKLIKYFLASLTVPEKDLWVNLSPYEKNRIIPEAFGITEMGRDLLAQDYLLKQITSSLMYPEKEIGEKFWNEVYKKIRVKYGNIDIPVDTFHKVWIVPEKAVVHTYDDVAFIAESKLKVMLEKDYLALEHAKTDDTLMSFDEKQEQAQPEVAEIIKEIIIPEIEHEVNNSKNFAPLRQIYHSMILATWFKRNLRETIIGKVYVGKNKVSGVDIADKAQKEKIYQQYLEAFRIGVYNYMKEDYDPHTQQIIARKCFSGGVRLKFGTMGQTVYAQYQNKDTVSSAIAEAPNQFQLIKAGIGESSLVGGFKKIRTAILNALGVTVIAASLFLSAGCFGPQPWLDVPPAELHTVYEDRMEARDIEAPATPDKLVLQLHKKLSSALNTPQESDEYPSNTKIYGKALEFIALALKEDGDVAIGNIGVALREDLKFGDPRLPDVLEAYNNLPGIYRLNEFDAQKPNLLFIHGAGRGAFSTFDFDRFKGDYNIAFFVYNHWDPLDDIVQIFKKELDSFTATLPEGQKHINVYVAHSYGNIIFREAVLKYGHQGQFKNSNFVQIAAPVGGSRHGIKYDFLPLPGKEALTKLFAGRAEHISWTLMPLEDKMEEMFNPHAVSVFTHRINKMFSIMIEGDNHNWRESDGERGRWGKFKKHFEAGRGQDYTALDISDETENPHGDAARNERVNHIMQLWMHQTLSSDRRKMERTTDEIDTSMTLPRLPERSAEKEIPERDTGAIATVAPPDVSPDNSEKQEPPETETQGSERGATDHAQAATEKKPVLAAFEDTETSGKNVGGIDLDPAGLKLESRGRGVDYDFDPATINLDDFEDIGGFAPVIFDIIPITHINILLGMEINSDVHES